MTDLSVVIPSYNTKETTKQCLTSLLNSLSVNKNFTFEIIVVDNGSKDGTVAMLNQIPQISVIANKKNLGFGAANNQGIKKATGRYILFLNSDVIVNQVNFIKLTEYLDEHEEVGALTVKVVLANGQLDKACHRGFPTLWNSFCYFLKLEKIFGQLPLLNRIFGGYHLTFKNLKTIHEIDSGSGAFYLTRKQLMDRTSGFDEDYFMYGEDIDLSFRIKKLGYKILYYSFYQVIHLKYSSGLKKNDGEIKEHFYNAMKIFYRKHYQADHPYLVNKLVYFFIDLKNKLS